MLKKPQSEGGKEVRGNVRGVSTICDWKSDETEIVARTKTCFVTNHSEPLFF